MSVTLVVPGTPAATVPFAAAVRGAASGAADPGPATDLLAAVRVTHAFSLSPVARGQGQQAPASIQVEDDSILEIELEGGLTLWTSVARYRAQLAVLKPEAVQADRVLFDVLPEPSASERGVKDWVANALRVLRLEADDLSLDLAARVAGKAGAWAATKLLVKRIESRLTPGPGLYRWADASTGQPRALTAPMVAGELEEGQDVLLFIHGTASSTLGSFGALTAPESHATWTALAEHFEHRVFALEHHTLSESPVENALQVAQALPRGTRLHLVSHSRGGLVGDLLCLRDLKDEEIARWRRDAGSAQADEADRRSLTALRDLLGQKQIEVVRFARVACPARGTLLASENIDEFLSILTNLIGMIPGFATSIVYDVIKRITLETVKNRWDPDMIPGIEAMIPSSPLVALLNAASVPARGDLGVIAGDIEGGNWLMRLGVFISDRFIYASRDNDLVVNTDSMFEGAPRSGGGHYVFDQGADVSHFNYFHNPRTRRALQQWLARAPSSPVPPGFRPIADEVQAPIPMPRAMRDRSGPALPVLVIVPALFGSRLCAGQQEVWPSFASLTHGGLARLIDGRATDGRGLRPTELVPDHYGRLGAALSDRHEVVPFAYDWRRSIREAAKALADEVTRALARTEQAVRIVAHGSGGLVVRQMIHEHAEIWARMGQRSGARVILIGTPNRGTYETVETLLGVGTTIRQLQLIDPGLGPQRLLAGFARWPGVLELLPSGGGLDFFDRETWRDLQRVHRHRVAVPEAGALRQAREFRAQLPERIPDAERVLYLTGTAPVTPSGLEIVDGRAVLLGTPRGDGRVTYESGLLPGVVTWYVPVEHGALLDPEALLPALVELLDRGTTDRLSRAAPAGERGGAATTFRYFPEGVLYPTEADLIRGLMGRRAPSRGRRARAALRVSVVHGDLRYASYPLLLGHYEGDTIAGAEAHLDRRLEGALSHRYQLGLYPGELGTTAVVLDRAADASPPGHAAGGAIVVGLGKMGDLNPNTLAETVRRGALSYVMQAAQTHGGPGGRDDVRAPNPRLGLSALLIGVTTATSIGVEDSVGAILRGITRANLEISQVLGGDLRITDLEIIELFADAAIEACRSAIRLVPLLDRELGVTIEAASRLRTARGRQERLRQTRYRDYWRRVEITLIQDEGEEAARRLVRREVIEQLISSVSQNLKDRPDQAKPLLDFLALPWRRGGAEGRLRFLALSDRARAEVMMQPRQLEVIDRLVATSVRDTQFKVDTANTLFELLLPNELKDTLGQQSWLVLVVDADTASYPWELMVDRQEPLSGKVGMVRQLATGTYRQQIRASTTNWAFVVGEPLTAPEIPPLPQARAEANMVAGLLRQNGYEVTHSEERPTALDVLNQLFARPYRILHLAGHGHYRAPRPGESEGRSGMVLQDGLFLTAVEIGQMRQVPDLVFLNCCHIGQVGSEVAFNKLAASASRELIQMGVRAVVAAGWAVRDDAAREFARIFYERMLGGAAFGRALLDARRETYNAHPDCNTWGAYQAYGDPDFKLRPGVGPTAVDEALSFVAPEEVVNELNAITERAAIEAERARTTRASAPVPHPGRKGKPGAKTGGMAVRLERLRADCPPDWLVRGDVLAALAEAYGELGDFEQATEHYRRALAAPSGTDGVSLRQVEQFANLEARWGEQTGRRDLIESAIGRVERLLQFGETSERLALLGSARKRFAQTLSDPHEIRRELVASRDYYQKAVQAGQRRGTIDHYWILNWIAGAAMLGQRVPDADAWLARVEAGGADRLAVSRSFWDAVGQADVALLRALLDGTLANPGTAEALLARYEAALRSSPPSPRELDSTLNQLRATAGLLQALSGDAASTANAEALRAIWTKLGGHHVSAADGHADEPAPATASEPRVPAAVPAAPEEHVDASTASSDPAPKSRPRAARRRPRPHP
jgi:CHAT domain-containing protein